MKVHSFVPNIFDNYVRVSDPFGQSKEVESHLHEYSITLFFLSAVMLPTDAVYAKDIIHGSRVFKESCSACHVGGQNLVVPSKSLSEEAIIRNLGSIDEETIKKFIQDGMVHRGVFAFGRLSDAEYTDVSSYVTAQALGKKW